MSPFFTVFFIARLPLPLNDDDEYDDDGDDYGGYLWIKLTKKIELAGEFFSPKKQNHLINMVHLYLYLICICVWVSRPLLVLLDDVDDNDNENSKAK